MRFFIGCMSLIAALVLGPNAGFAATVTGSFSGVLTDDDVAGFFGEWMGVPATEFHAGDAVSGTFRYDPATLSPTIVGTITSYDGSGVEFDWQIGSHHFSFSGATGSVTLIEFSTLDRIYGVRAFGSVPISGTKHYDYSVGITVRDVAPNLFTSRDDLTSVAYQGLISSLGFGYSFVDDFSSESSPVSGFEINPLGTSRSLVSSVPVATTPVPPSLPLFAVAIGGLGLIGWRRRLAA